jgi:hypothetical protein
VNERERGRERVRKKGKIIIALSTTIERMNDSEKKRINLYVKPKKKKKRRKMFVAHDINLLTLDVVVIVIS